MEKGMERVTILKVSCDRSILFIETGFHKESCSEPKNFKHQSKKCFLIQLTCQQKRNIIKSMKTDSCNQSQCVNRTLQFVRKNKRASKIQLTLSQFVFLTACQQLLLHTCDWLGLKRLRINTPCVPYRDVSLLHPAMHPQYVTITQQILSLKFSVAYKMQCRGYSE